MTQHKTELAKITVAANQFFPKGGFVAGGALTSAFTNGSINDVDIYFKTKEDFIEAVACAYDEQLWCVAHSDRAITFAHRDGVVQLMHFDFFATAEAIFDAFDYTVCMAAYDIDKEEFVFHEDFLKHNSQRYLKFHNGTRYPFGSLMRVLKYQQRGYTIGKSDLLRIGLKCSEVEINSWEDLAAAIGGQYGEKALVETDKEFSIDAALDLFTNSEITVTAKSEEQPGNAFDLLTKLGFDEQSLKAQDVEATKPWRMW